MRITRIYSFGTNMTPRNRLFAVAVALAGALSSACSSDAPEEEGPGQTSQSAVLLAAEVLTPDDFLTYVGIFPEVPRGDVDFDDFREFGNANVYVNEGRVFVEQDGVVQRFDVNDELKLVDGPRFSWADFGIATANASYTVFVSSTRAYSFAPDLDVIVIWNPETMERTGAIELEYPARPEGMETWANDGYLVGDKVIWNVFSGDFDNITVYPAVTLVIADANSDAPPTFVEDSRCLPGGPSFVADNGDYYVHGAGFFGYFYAYGEPADGVGTCELRVKAGEVEFDPDYRVDYEAATGSAINTPWIGLGGNQYFTRAWDPDVALPEVPDDFWAGEGLRPLVVDQADGSSKPYPDLNNVFDVDGVTRIVDGVSYFAIADDERAPGGSCDVVELHPDGIQQGFHMDGGYLKALERVR
jgi:hypothetical protein